MTRTILAAIAAFAALPALADEVRLAAPIEAGSLRTDDVSLVAYFVPAGDDLVEVTATWLGDDDTEPRRLVMGLADGDEVGFALPGHLDTLFTFSRSSDAVTVDAKPVAEKIRNASL
jgi:hypothetical protein